MSRTFLWMLALAAPVLPGISAAQPEHDEITVSGEGFTHWSEMVGKALDAKLQYPRPVGTNRYEEGVVQIAFRCDENGRPAQVAVQKSSGSNQLDAAALRAVNAIPTLHPLPAGLGMGRQFQANILFAVDDGSTQRIDRMWRKVNGLALAANNNGRHAKASLLASRILLVPIGEPARAATN